MKRTISILLTALMMLPLFAVLPASAQEYDEIPGVTLTYYVSADGKADADGSADDPFASIEAARDAIRELKNGAGLPDGGITVIVKNGIYNVTDNITFTSEDSGSEKCPISYVSEELHGAILTSAAVLDYSDFVPLSKEESDRIIDKDAAGKVLKLDLSKYGVTADNVSAPSRDYRFDLAVDGAVMKYAEYPNASYHRAPSEIEAERTTKLVITEEDAARIAGWKDISEASVYCFTTYEWATANADIASFDSANNAVEVHGSYGYGFGTRSRYRFINVMEEIDTAGEYFLDRKNCVLYAYLPDGAENALITANIAETRIIYATNAEHLTFHGFDINGTRTEAVSLNDCRSVTLDSLKVSNIGDVGINARGYNITIQNCDISGTGADGIRIYGGDRTTLTPSNNLIYNNYIHDWATRGQTYRPGVRVDGVGITVSHNEICNSLHFAILYYGNDNIFEYNYIHDVVTDSSDAGAIYAGRHYAYYGNVMRYNYFEDIGSAEMGSAMAIYWDDGLSGQTAYGNVINRVYGKNSFAVMVGGGRDNTIENNIFIDIYDGDSPVGYVISVDSRARTGYFDPTYWAGDPYGHVWQFEEVPYNTGIWAEKYPALAKVKYVKETLRDDDDEYAFFNPAFNVYRNNAFYTSGAGPKIQQFDLSGVNHEMPENIIDSTVNENNAQVAKNLSDFVDAANGNMNLKKDAALFGKIPGFVEIPFDEIGLVSDEVEMNFRDVNEKKWFYDAVYYVFCKGLMTGKTEDTFVPNENMTRAQLVTVLYRMEGQPSTDVKVPFTDLKQAWYRDAVKWAYENSIVNGKSDTEFDPLGSITREQMAAILYRYCEYKKIDVSDSAALDSFPDVGKVHSYAEVPMKWAYATELITGKAEGERVVLDPRGSATRAQVATILMRFCEKYN
ncbi:MAG: S-layer homology domain-containing protein [Clostridia bacterium]|nr:S-layer homology domain-containing protein [Clostridia bacterium]